MKRILSFYFLFFFLLPILSYSQGTNLSLGNEFISSLLVEKNYVQAYTFFDESVKSKIAEPLLKETVEKLEMQLGKFKSVIETTNENETYLYYADFEKFKLDIRIAFNEKSKIIGFFFVPHKEFKKQPSLGKEYTIMSNGIDLKGTLLIPENGNLKKLVLFVHGSGPNDRDETVFENKPFKDIAESLFANGIASYRFDKRTYTNPESFSDKSTIDDEVTNDILNIVKYFKSDSQFSDYEIIVLGHSLGAFVLPRIATRSNQISKIILLAGNARPLDVLIQEQFDYLYTLNPSNEMKAEREKISHQIENLHSKSFNLTTSKDNLPLGLSSPYWKSILDYKPLKDIQKVNIPTLIVQGERDYQVTMKDFELWKSGVQHKKKVKCISYPGLNHLFMTGTSPSTPQEYSIKGTVDTKVIKDIKDFIVAE